MKTIQSAIIKILFLVLLSGCMKNEFSLQFEFPKDHIGNYMVDYYAWDSKKGSWIESVASVQGGKATVRCITNRPTLVYIRDASSSSNSIVVYAERGDELVISGDKSDMNTWMVKGNKESKRWSEWRNKNASVLFNGKENFSKEKEKAISDFVNANKNSALSTMILLTEWDRNVNPDGFLKLWNSIDDDAKDRQLLEMCGCPDLIGVEFEVNAEGKLARTKENKHKQLVFRTRDNGLDTLKFNKVKSSLLYFFTENNSERGVVMDSIKALTKTYNDSTKRIIADICLRPDSMVWINSLRSDTIKGMVRAWSPAGFADHNLIRLGVIREPWFIVMRKDGTDAYSGKDLNDAIAAFRKEMDKKETAKSAPKSSSKKHDS
ncbi:MAG: hypothetical protein NC095_08375 [Muribaculum sp.]|nr:hypothetical protein [Muribaculum sp.]